VRRGVVRYKKTSRDVVQIGNFMGSMALAFFWNPTPPLISLSFCSFLLQIILEVKEKVKLNLIELERFFFFILWLWCERGLSTDYSIGACALNETIHMLACCHHLCLIVNPEKECIH